MPELGIERLPGGPWGQNCYLVVSGRTALVVDPGGDGDMVLDILRERDLDLVGILCTHGHFDHIAGVAEITEATGVPLSISGRDERILRAANLHSFVCGHGRSVRVPKIGRDIDELGTALSFGDIDVTSIPTPGHTPGSYAFLIGASLLGGDTLLGPAMSDSRLPGADMEEQARSVERLRTQADPDLTLLPGHGPARPLATALRTAQLAQSAGA
jgi:glyoxylase-like metal-dependent hydrolase (beta-lactamase superfamily II)